MNCPKCKKEIPYNSNLCCYCGNPIREKCKELLEDGMGCDGMELIGRKVCEVKYKEANKKIVVHIENKLKQLPLHIRNDNVASWLSLVGVGVATSLGIVSVSREIISDGLCWFLFCVFLALIFAFKIMLFRKKSSAIKSAQLDFFNKFPHYAEIIKKAESADA